ASTITVMVVFLPLFLIQGLAGQMFTQFALVVIFSIAISLLDALTVVPMLASRLIKEEELKKTEEEERGRDPIQGDGKRPRDATGDQAADSGRAAPGPIERVFRWFGDRFHALDASYRHGLAWALKHRGWVIGGAVAAMAATFLLVPQIGAELLPQTDSGNFNV